ncbi:MAG: endonuclease/exonuclease/phosphatase family protein [Clostridia bacterium]|nr:endonuclease/exonuclease/phosphatase family protein [Clostridia bacterium]
MKKTISLLLSVLLVLSCFAFATTATAVENFETESGVQIKIAPFLYKSAQHQMEFPSHQSYAVKEKSVAGDYAISRALNDLAYTFVFPAGTTGIACNVSLDGKDWRGYTVNSTANPNYWEKDADGNVDLTQPLTFRRVDYIAEQDEYGVLYRDYLMHTDAQGFRDFDKIYWQLAYICNGETVTEYFEQPLYDYDKAEKYGLKAVNFNVAGLPFAALAGANLTANHADAAAYFNENDFDIVAVQEDFGYHSTLVENMDGFGYATNHTGNVPFGDGLNIFTRNMPVYNETRVTWDESCGILTDGSDELTPKGFVYSVIDVGNGIYVDFYNLHADAYAGAGSKAARTSQFKQLAAFIEARSAEHDRPVIITGDFNYHIHTQEDNGSLYNIFCEQGGFEDAWVEFHNNGDYFNMSEWHKTGLESWGNWDSVERFLYRAGGGVDVVVSDFRYVEVCNEAGESISDHNSAECEFTFIKNADFVENTEELSVTEAPNRDIMFILKRIFDTLKLIFSEIDKLPALLKELTATA